MERTRVITATITIIEKNAKEETADKKAIADALKKQLNADDVQITSLKDFLLTPKKKKEDK